MYKMSRVRLSVVAAIALAGAGCAESVVGVEKPDQPVGTFALTEAAGKALPSKVFEGILLDENDNFYTMTYEAKSGYLSIDSEGNYEHRVFHDVRIDGQLTTDGRWVDRGKCTITANAVDCISNLLENVTFKATFSGGALEMTQDFTGEGFAASYRYVRNS